MLQVAEWILSALFSLLVQVIPKPQVQSNKNQVFHAPVWMKLSIPKAENIWAIQVRSAFCYCNLTGAIWEDFQKSCQIAQGTCPDHAKT